MKFSLVVPAVLAMFSAFALAQNAPPPATASEDAQAEPPAAAETPGQVTSVAPEPDKPRGDVLTLKSGQVIQGLQILRETSANYVLQVIEGITLNIPRRQVVSVEYDDYDPALHRTKPTMIRGQRLSDVLEAALNTDISNPPFQYEDADLVQVLNDMKARFDGKLTIDPSVTESMPPASRAWTVASEPGITLGDLLRKKLLVDFPDLVMVFKDDEIVITTKDAASTASSASGDAAGTSPDTPPATGEATPTPVPPAAEDGGANTPVANPVGGTSP